ncbi:MAG: VWA domain-containing protein [Congregibacter sp.]
MLEFALPFALLLLPVPLLIYALAPPYREARESLRVPYFRLLASVSGEEPKPGASVVRRRWIQGTISWLGWLLLVAAAAQPQWVGPPVVMEKTARDLMLLLDLSGSMDTADFATDDGREQNRLEAAKSVLKDFVDNRAGDRLGLIVFGDAAYLQVPFTDDHDTWITLLDESEVAMAGQSTALGDAIGLAISLFQASETKNRVLIALTDGNDTGSRVPPVEAAAVAASEEVTIYTVAVGDPTTVGEEALDIDALVDVSELTGGRSFLATDRAALDEAYADIDRLEPAEYDRLSYRPRRDIFHYPLGAFAALYLLFLPLFALQGWRTRRNADD